MAWSIVEYDSLHILYTDLNNDQYVIRKAATAANEIYTGSDDVALVVDSVASVYKTVPRDMYRAMPPLIPGLWSATLRYTEASTPIATSGSDLVNKIYELLRSADVKVELNGTFVGEQSAINFIEGENIYITAAADTVNDRVDVTFSAEDAFPKILMLMGG